MIAVVGIARKRILANSALVQQTKLPAGLAPTRSSRSYTASFSTTSTHNSENNDSSDSNENTNSSRQAFVRTRIPAGEWDLPGKTDPLYRPKWKSKSARIISAEDFANRPKVGFSGEFASMSEAMVTLSWLNQEQCQTIYREYMELLTTLSQSNQGVSSHEYVIRLLAYKFNVTQERIAATVRLQHNEEQYKRDGKRKLLQEEADYMDQAIQKEIEEAYKAEGKNVKPPTDFFIEDPVAVSGRKEAKAYTTSVADHYDVDQLLEQAHLREREEARLVIENHVYSVDQDLDQIKIPQSKDCAKLLKQHAEFQKKSPEKASSTSTIANTNPLPTQHPRRTRWKYVAQIVNTRDLKLKQSKRRSYKNNHPVNTIVHEENVDDKSTILRFATRQDVQEISWKSTRNPQEFIYRPVQQGWLDKIHRQQNEKWGLAPERPETSGGGESSSSSESDESSSSSSEEETEAVEDETQEVPEDEKKDWSS